MDSGLQTGILGLVSFVVCFLLGAWAARGLPVTWLRRPPPP